MHKIHRKENNLKIIFNLKTVACRERFVGNSILNGHRDLKDFQKTYETGVLFDEYVVVDTEVGVSMAFYENDSDFIKLGKARFVVKTDPYDLILYPFVTPSNVRRKERYNGNQRVS